MQTIAINLPAPHSDWQSRMIHTKNNIVAFGGRRAGKTYGGVMRIFKAATTESGLYWWVGVSWKSASLKRAWRMLRHYASITWRAYAGNVPNGVINKSAKEIKLPNGGEIWFRTADNEESLAGEGIKGAVVDEFSLMNERVWSEYLEATLLDFNGWVTMLGVPKGMNWATALWNNSADWDGWEQMHFTTYDNPYMKREAIDAIKSKVTSQLFNQEYLAQAINWSGGVFRNVQQAVNADVWLERGEENGRYIMGVDWGRSNDFTVITTIDTEARHVVHIDRFNMIDYQTQAQRLKALYERFKPFSIIAESNAMGQAVIDFMQGSGLPIQPFRTTNQSKKMAVDTLNFAFSNGDITIPDYKPLINELLSFEATPLSNGMLRYAASKGGHDDTVMSLLIGWSGIDDGHSLILF